MINKGIHQTIIQSCSNRINGKKENNEVPYDLEWTRECQSPMAIKSLTSWRMLAAEGSTTIGLFRITHGGLILLCKRPENGVFVSPLWELEFVRFNGKIWCCGLRCQVKWHIPFDISQEIMNYKQRDLKIYV